MKSYIVNKKKSIVLATSFILISMVLIPLVTSEMAEISGDRIVFKNIYAGDSAVDFFGSKLEADDIIFDTLTFINSNMYFDPDKKIRDGKTGIKVRD